MVVASGQVHYSAAELCMLIQPPRQLLQALACLQVSTNDFKNGLNVEVGWAAWVPASPMGCLVLDPQLLGWEAVLFMPPCLALVCSIASCMLASLWHRCLHMHTTHVVWKFAWLHMRAGGWGAMEGGRGDAEKH
jgi:hypothetical protein